MESYSSYTERSQSCSLDEKPSSEGSFSEQLPSDGISRSVLAVATTTAASAASAAEASATSSTDQAAALPTKTPRIYSKPPCTDPSSDLSIYGDPGSGSSFTNIGFEPAYISRIVQDPCTTTNSSFSYKPYDSTSSSLGPGYGSGKGSGPGPNSGSGSGPGTTSDSGSVPGLASDSGPGPGSGPRPAFDSRPSPGSGPQPGSNPERRRHKEDVVPNYISWNQQNHPEPQKPPSWEFLQVPEPGSRGLWKPSTIQGKSKGFFGTLPRGQCLLYNWEEERATNHLDQVPCMQDGSESFFFRHGHRGLLSLQLQSPMPSSTTQKDSYQPPANLCQPLRGKREAMLELLLHHKICKEVQAEQEPTRKIFETESVTHHDYRMELVRAGPPAPTKSHDYRREQPETFWLQRAPQLPGVSCIKTLDAPFRRNCSFTTPVPLSLGQPLPYEPENYPRPLGEMSSLACQGGGQCGRGGRATPV